MWQRCPSSINIDEVLQIGAFPAWVSSAPTNATSTRFSRLAMVHIVPMTSRRSASLIGSKHRGIWNIYDIISLAHIPVVFIYAPGLELTIPGVKKTERAEIRRYVMLNADLLFGSRPEDMTTWIA
jgi:hypothetical protein